VVVCLERDADLHMVQLMPLTVSVLPAHLGSPGKGPSNGCSFCLLVDALMLL